MVRPFRFGVSAHRAASAAEWRDTARRAEDLGYATLLSADHLNDQLAPLPALAVAAAVTTTLRVGTMVLANDFRRPVVLAKELATLDLLSDGRLEWGMGTGWFPPDYEPAGITMDPPGVRVSRLAESITAIKALLGGEPTELDGEHVTLRGLAGTPRPVQRPHPPLVVGAAQDRVLRLAGREADIVSISPDIRSRQFGPFPPSRSVVEGIEHQLAVIRGAAGPRADELELSVNLMPARVVADPRPHLEKVAASLGIDVTQAADAPHVVLGTVDGICELLEARRARWGISYYVVGEPVMAEWAPVVERLAGR